jgi:ABC-type uncharacterized transport system auxiliary subunit
MMANARALALMSVLISILVSGCMSRIKYPNYYTLHFSPVVDPPPKKDRLPSIAVRQFQAPPYLRQGPIVYRISPGQIGFYEYHRWAVDPRSAITDAVVDRLAASGNFAKVLVYDGRADVDYILSGRLENLDEVDYEGDVAVQVALSVQLTEFQSGKTIWTNSASDTVKVDRRNVPAIVAEMSSLTDRTIEKLLASLAVPEISEGK